MCLSTHVEISCSEWNEWPSSLSIHPASQTHSALFSPKIYPPRLLQIELSCCSAVSRNNANYTARALAAVDAREPACSTSEATPAGAPSRTRSAATPSRSSPPSSSVTPMCSSSLTRSSCLHRTAAGRRRWLPSVTTAPRSARLGLTEVPGRASLPLSRSAQPRPPGSLSRGRAVPHTQSGLAVRPPADPGAHRLLRATLWA